MHDILIDIINDWSRKVVASKAFLLVQHEYINSYIKHEGIMSIQCIICCKYYCIDETMIIVTQRVNKHMC